MQHIKTEPQRQRPDSPGTVVMEPLQDITNSANTGNNRFARSGAPSASTGPRRRLPTQASSSTSISTGEEDQDVLMMEIRDIKPGQQRQQQNRPMAVAEQTTADGPMTSARTGATAANVSFVSHSFTAIGDKVKALNDTLGELQSLGIQHVTNLPELVLVGDQSAGKSSLMSSFSGMYLPRSEGACTRCPVHIRLSGSSNSSAASWSCRITLQQDYAYVDGQSTNVTRNSPFGPWREQPRVVRDFGLLLDPAGIEDTLRWAQIATLNPSQDPNLYKPGSGEIWRRANDGGSGIGTGNQNETAFSPNTVALDIVAPDLADLSFYDLPGVFSSAKRDEDQYLVKVVTNLTAKYIAHQQAIILWAVPMNADPETSATFSIIRANKAQSRTIGIMTKADLLPQDAHAESQWMAMLRGQQHVVGHGYFLTARPPTSECQEDGLNNTPNQNNNRPRNDLERQGAFEEAFFNKRLPGNDARTEWRSCFQEFEDRCGVTRLVAFMSQQLGTEFAKSLPQIQVKVSAKLQDVLEELATLPDEPQNPELVLRSSLSEFAMQVRLVLKGDELSQSWTQLVSQFQAEIAALKPKYHVRLKKTANSTIDLTREDGGDMGLSQAGSQASSQPGPPGPPGPPFTPTNNRIRDVNINHYGSGTSPSKRPRFKTETQSDGSRTPRSLSGGIPGSFSGPMPAKTLPEIRAIIEAKRTPGMQGIVTEDVYNALCMEAVRPWWGPIEALVERACRLLEDKLQQMLGEALRGLQARQVFPRATTILRMFLEQRRAQLRTSLRELYELETFQSYTQNKRSMDANTEAEKQTLGYHRAFARVRAFLGEERTENLNPHLWENKVPGGSGLPDHERKRAQDKLAIEAAKLGPDPFREELDVCAYVRGYYLTASERLVDNVTMHLLSGMVPKVAAALGRLYVDNELGVLEGATPALFRELMAEDAATTARRDQLKADRQRFEQTMASIERLEQQPVEEAV